MNITANRVTLKNINFINGKITTGGAIYWFGENGIINQCNFNNNTATSSTPYTNGGGAIYYLGDNGTINQCNFTQNTAISGGAIHWNGANGTINQCNFNQNAVTHLKIFYKQGGAIYWFGENGTITNSNFNNNTADQGGAIKWEVANGTVTYCNFTGNIANYEGGAIYFTEFNNGILTDCTFTNNTAHDGGAIYGYGANGTVSYCNFTGNIANYTFGGAINWEGANGTVTGCTFTSNTARRYGGAIIWHGENGNITDCTFISNNANFGGAIYWSEYAANGTVTYCTFTNNTANEGGAIIWHGENGNITDCTFISNNANFGGAIYWSEYAANGTVTYCTFTNNTANEGGGGAIYLTNSANGKITNTNFNNNTAGTFGGAIYWHYSTTNGTVTYCNFTGNTAHDGGAIYWNSTNGKITNSNFNNNTAGTFGGAIYWNSTNGKITNTNFNQNTASIGGAIEWEGENGTINQCNFTQNTANQGGAIELFRDNKTITNSNFNNNTADRGGAIIWYGANGKINQCNFTQNTAREFGGAINWNSVNGTINQCNFNQNTVNFSGGAIYLDSGKNGTITNSNFNNNTANYTGGAISWYVENGIISNSTFKGNKADFCRNIFIYSQMILVNSTLETFVTISQIPDCDAGSNATINITFDDGTDFEEHNIILYNNNNLITTLTYNHDYKYTYTWNNLVAGDYSITVGNNNNYNNKYIADYSPMKFKVTANKNASSVNIISIVNGTYKTVNATISFNIVNRTTLTITVIDTKTGIIVYQNANYVGNIFTIGNLTIGEYYITIINNENENYTSSSATASFSINETESGKSPSEVKIISIVNGTYKTVNATISFNIVNRTTLTITVIDTKTGIIVYQNANYVGNIFTIGNLTIGEYYIIIINNENENYASSSATALFNIAKVKLNPTDVNISVNPGKCNATLNITTLKDFTGDIDIIIDNVSYPISVINGTGSKVIILPPGNHNLTGANITNNPLYDDTFIPKDETFDIDKKTLKPDDIIVNVTPGQGNATVNITAPKDFTGDINVIINGTNYPISIVNGTGIEVIPLVPGEYNITGANITNNPSYDDTLIPKDETFDIDKKTLKPDDIIVNVTPGQGNATVNITAPKDFTGDINVIINGTNYPIPVINGTGSKIIPLTPGKYNLTGANITNNPLYDDTFIPKDETFDIDKKTLKPDDIIVNVTPGQGNATLTITAPKDINGNVDVIIDNVSYPIEVINGTGSKIIPLTPGKHKLTGANITNNPVYDDTFIPITNGEFIIKKDINPNDIIVNVTPGQGNATLNVTAPKDFNGNVNVVIDNKNYPVKVINGTGSKVILLPAGNHNITGTNITNNPLYYDTFIPKTGNTTFNVDYADLNPGDINVNVTPGQGNVTVNVTAPKDFNGNITVTIDNTTYPIPVINGTGSKVIPLTPGNHNITGVNITDDPRYNNTFIPESISFVVDPQHTYSIINNKDMKVFYREGAKYTVRIVDETGKPVSGKTVTFKVNDITFTTISDADGYASVIIDWKPGKSIISTTCENTTVFNSIQVKSVIHATKNVKVKKSKKNTKFKVTLWGLRAKIVKKPTFKYNGKKKVPIKIGKDLAGKKVSVKFKGEYFTTKVDSKGKGVLKISKKLAHELKLKKGKKYKGRVVYKDMIIYKNTPVNVKIDGKTYTVKTNKNGAFIFKITKKMVKKLKPGKKYPYYIEFGENTAKRNLIIKK